jgi:NAD(P)H-flavin reductase
MQKPTTTPLTISHIDYSPSGDVILLYCAVGTTPIARPWEEDSQLWFLISNLWFSSGQFMLLAAEIDCKTIKRSYSIATTPQLLSDQWLIWFSIKRVEGGVFSTRATQVARTGDTLTMTGPLWHMTDDEQFDDYLLISAGSWLSPIYSIYHSLLQSSRSIRIANIFGERYFSHVLPCVHHDWVENIWSLSWPHIDPTLTPLLTPNNIYSQCFLSQDEHGGYMIGRVQLWLVNALDRLATTQIKVFICWAPAMVDEVRNLLIAEYGIDPTQIKFEKY